VRMNTAFNLIIPQILHSNKLIVTKSPWIRRAVGR